jgi:hypothetical protein
VPGVRIPTAVQPGFKALLRLDEASTEALMTALQEASPALPTDELVKQTALRVPALSPDDAGELIVAVLSLYGLRATMEKPPPELASDIADALEASDDPDLKAAGPRRAAVIGVLTRLLSVNALETRMKVADIYVAYERIFVQARILSDIRAVFGPNVGEPPTEALIIHNLRLTYHEGDEHKDFYVALDDRDLEALVSVLERAKLKTRSLKTLLDAAKVPYPREA